MNEGSVLELSEGATSKEKGDALELAVFEEVVRALNAGEFGLSPEACRVYRQKSYFSHQRQTSVLLDVTVELFSPGSDEMSMLWVFECKNRERPVQFSDVDALTGSLRGIAQHKTKVIMVSSGGFTKPVIEAARREGVSLVLFTPEQELQWVLHRSSSKIHSRLSELAPDARRRTKFACLGPSGVTDSFAGLTRMLLGHEPEVDSDESVVPFVSSDDIESLVEELSELAGAGSEGSPLAAVEGLLARRDGVQVRRWERSDVSEAGLMLGRISFGTPTIIELFPFEGYSPGRTNFTLAHELGHHVLGHGRFLARDAVSMEEEAADYNLREGKSDLARMEYQANRFAVALLMPKARIWKAMESLVPRFELQDRGHGLLYLDGQRVNQTAFHGVANSLMSTFGASKMAVKSRLKELRILREPWEPPVRKNRRREFT